MTANREPSSEECQCPYWSKINRSCQLISGGLFIPVTEHVEAYCQAGNYLSCPHLIHVREIEQLPGENDEACNRRRYERTPSRYIIKVSEYPSKDMVAEPLDDSACTVDISPGGIRLESFKHFQAGTLVSLYLDQSAGIGLRSLGKVKWCKSLINTPFYHAGIDLEDKFSPNSTRKSTGAKTLPTDVDLAA